jgi:hypothetical protein
MAAASFRLRHAILHFFDVRPNNPAREMATARPDARWLLTSVVTQLSSGCDNDGDGDGSMSGAHYTHRTSGRNNTNTEWNKDSSERTGADSTRRDNNSGTSDKRSSRRGIQN